MTRRRSSVLRLMGDTFIPGARRETSSCGIGSRSRSRRLSRAIQGVYWLWRRVRRRNGCLALLVSEMVTSSAIPSHPNEQATARCESGPLRLSPFSMSLHHTWTPIQEIYIPSHTPPHSPPSTLAAKIRPSNGSTSPTYQRQKQTRLTQKVLQLLEHRGSASTNSSIAYLSLRVIPSLRRRPDLRRGTL
jgi:hypothetical protein